MRAAASGDDHDYDSADRRRSRRRIRNLVILTFLAVVVTLPLVQTLREDHRLATEGVVVTATATAARESGGRYGVVFRFPADVDPSAREWPAVVDRATYDAAERLHQVAVRVVPGSPSVYRASGQDGGHTGLIVGTVVGDLVIALVALVLLRDRRRPAEPDVDGADPDAGTP